MNNAQAEPITGPPFRITAVRVQDFRVLEHIYVELAELTVLVGENNVGKTALLAALDYALAGGRPTEDDLHVSPQGRKSTFIVDVRLEPWTGNTFPQAINDRFEGVVQLDPTYIAFRAEGRPSEDGSGPTMERTFLQGWGTNEAEAEVLPTLGAATSTHMRHIQYALLDARRDLADQLTRRRSHWGRLTSDLAVPAQDVAALEQALDETARRIVASSPTLTAVEGELAGVREALGSAISSVAITPLPSQLEEIARRADVVVGAPDAVPLPLRMQGLGARSLAAATVFRALTKSVVGGGASTSALSVTGLEEPEAHLHPQAHRAMFEIIISLPGQKVLSTHSPYVARVAGVHDIRVFRRNATGVHVRFVPKLKADGNPTFTDEERAKIERFFQRHHSEALFSRVTILYEGETEHVAMPVFARHFLGIDPSVEGMTLISLEGVANLGHIAPALDALGINWCVMVDGDQAARDALATASNKMSRVLDSTSPEVVMLDSVDYETHLVDCGYRPEIEHYIATRHGGTALATYRNAHHGQNNRDYQSDGWEGRLLVDYMRSHCKGAEARHIATAIVASDRTHAVIPTGIGDLLTRGSQVAGVAQ